MSSTIFETLPTLHLTFIGLIATVYTAYAAYAYQKINDAKEQLVNAVNSCVEICANNPSFQMGTEQFTDANGTINWSESGTRILNNVAFLYPDEDSKERDAIFNFSQKSEPLPHEVISACEELSNLLTCVFTSYPFWKTEVYHSQKNKINTSELCVSELDGARIEEIKRTVGRINATWDSKREGILICAKKATEYLREKQLKEERMVFENRTSQDQSYPYSDEQKSYIWKKFHLPWTNSVDYSRVFMKFFDCSKKIESESIPLLSEALHKLEQNKKNFNVSKFLRLSLILTLISLVLGVILPIMLQYLFEAYPEYENSIYTMSGGVGLIIFTTIPYLIAIGSVFKTINKASSANSK